MKYILPTLGAVAAVSLFALSNANQTAIAVERPSYDETFKQLEISSKTQLMACFNHLTLIPAI